MHNDDRARGSIFPIAALFCTLLAACGGGGGGGSTSGGGVVPTVTPCPAGYSGAAPNCTAPTTTTANGKLVDDASNAPLAGISVKLEPWVGGATPLPSPQATTAADGSFSLGNVPNGHYLLVIGSDSSSDTTRPTIHDNVTLTGGIQTLKAPTLPPLPTVTPPAAEVSGNYRLTTIDQTNELPCFSDFNQQRTSHSLPVVVVDEWLTENARAANAYRASGQTGQPTPGNGYGYLTTGNVTTGGGGGVCTAPATFAFNGTNPYATNANTQWFAGTDYNYANGTQATGVLEFPIDPRVFTDPNVPVWP